MSMDCAQKVLESEDGVHGMVPRDRMAVHVRALRDAYARVPGARLYRKEFGWMDGVMEKWKSQGMSGDMDTIFQFDPPAKFHLNELGWCEAAFAPHFPEEILENRGEHELVRDWAGRHVLFFKGRRNGFMPEYVDHPVKDWKTWEEDVKWRLAPTTEERYANLDERMKVAKANAAEGVMISQNIIGAYMYLRSLMGPEELLYVFYDQPDLVHDCMQTWLALADTVTARHQQYVTLDEIYFGEDICYNHGPLISPDMIREFLFPYYQQLIENTRARQIDKSRHLYVQIDTDGKAMPVIPVYQEIGMDAMSPFEVASDCDVVAVGKQWPELAVFGGIDKRILAQGKTAIDAMLDRIIPCMRERGGFVPTCDHSVPLEVNFEDYLHYRTRVVELGG